MAKSSDKEWDGKRGDDDRDEAPKDTYAGKDSGPAKEAKERKRGGKVEERETDKRHERKERKRGGKVAAMEGGASKHRLDRPGRKRGGGVGADKSPLSSAARTHDRREGSGESAVTGGM